MSTDEFISAFAQDKLTRKDVVIKQLQDDLAQEKDRRREDWFIGIVLFTVLLNVFFFTVIPTLSGPFVLLILELLILFPLAKRLGMEQIAEMIDRILGRMASGVGNKNRN